MITEDYVSFETAKLLKEKGFDKYPLFPCYKEDNGEFIDIPTTLDTINYCFIPAPTLQMAMKWLREEKGIAVVPILSSVLDNEKFLWDIEIIVAKTNETYHQGWIYESYKQACEAAIKYCIEHLI